MKSCYNCIFCLHGEPPDYEIWCPMKIRIIDDGFGEGDSNPCEQYIPTGKQIAFNNVTESEKELPF